MGSEDANYLAFLIFFFFISSTQRIPAPHTRPRPGSRLQEWGDVAWESGGLGKRKDAFVALLLLSLPLRRPA